VPVLRPNYSKMLGSIVFSHDLLAIFHSETSTWCYVHGHSFAVPGGIASKISKDMMPKILVTPRAKFHTDQ